MFSKDSPSARRVKFAATNSHRLFDIASVHAELWGDIITLSSFSIGNRDGHGFGFDALG